ncbi:MAG: hypothetical protein AB1414_06715 [bacterium]
MKKILSIIAVALLLNNIGLSIAGEILSPPNPPTLSSPPNGSNAPGTVVQFRWNPSPGANNYWLQVSLNSNFTQLVFDKAIGNYIGVNLSGFPDNGTKYWWRVKAGNVEGWSSWSSVWNFTNGPSSPPDPSTLISPPNGSNAPGTVVQFRWNPSPRANNYWLQVSLNSNFTQLVFD